MPPPRQDPSQRGSGEATVSEQIQT